jgi:hypothetical protein
VKAAVSSAHDEALIVACVAEAESMAIAYRISRSPRFVRGSHLRVFDKLLFAHVVNLHEVEDTQKIK